MSADLKLHYTESLENWTMPMLRFSKHKNTFGSTIKQRKTAMIQPLLREIVEKNDEKPGLRYETHQRNVKTSELQNTSLIEIREILKKERKITIVQGTGGIGKTSLVDFITYQWAQNELFMKEEDLQFLFVFRFQCRSLNRYRGRKLTANDLFMEKFNVNISNIHSVRGENILIVLDGFDEFFAYRDIFNFDNKEDSITSIVRSLVTQETVLFRGHYTLVTGRHHAVDVLQKQEKRTGKARWVEVLGFSERAVEKYVDDQFSEGNSSLAAYIKDRISSSVTLQNLATTPVFLRTLCSILCIEDIELDAKNMVKMTDIYAWIVGSFLKFHFASKEREFIEIPLSELLSSEDVRKFLRDISKDSYELLIANELEFDCQKLSSVNMSDPVIRNLVSGFVLKKEDEIESKCEFWHVTMQEFFAGYYCFTKNMNVSKLQEGNWFHAVQFVAGFSSTRYKTKKDIKHILLGDYLFVKQDSIDMILSLFSNDAFFDPNNSRELKRNYLQIFFEAFDAKDKLPFLDIADKHAGPSSNATWEIYSLSDASLFIHFARLMIANDMEVKLRKVTLIIRSITLKYATFGGLFEVFPFCYILYLDSVQMAIKLSGKSSRHLLAPFKAGQHTLRGISLSNCSMSKAVNDMFVNIIPLIREVVLTHQHVSFQDAEATSNSIANTRYEHPTMSAMRLVFFTSIACTFEKGSGKRLGKVLAFVKVVQIYYLQDEFNEIKVITQGIRRVLADTSISMFDKIQNFTLTAAEQTVVHGDFIALAKSLSYLQVVDLGEAVLTNGFVSKLVKCFLALVEKDRYAVQLKRLRIQSSQSSRTTFMIEKLAKIIPFIQVVDLRYFQLSLYDYKILSDSISKAANSNMYGSELQVLRLGSVFNGIYSNFNTYLMPLYVVKRKFFAAVENVLKVREWQDKVWNNFHLIRDAEDAIRSYSSKDYGKSLPFQAAVIRMLSQAEKGMSRIVQKSGVLVKEIVGQAAKTKFLVASEKGRSYGQLQVKQFFSNYKVMESSASYLVSETKRLLELVHGLKRDSDQWVLETKRKIRDDAMCGLLSDTALFDKTTNVYKEELRQEILRELLPRLQERIAYLEQILSSLNDTKRYLAMSSSSWQKMSSDYDKLKFENEKLNALEMRQKNQALSYVAKIVSLVPIVDMSDTDILTYDLCSQLFKEIRDVKKNEHFQRSTSLLILGNNFKSCGKATELSSWYVSAVKELDFQIF